MAQSVTVTTCSLRASRLMHEAMLRKLVAARMSFFDVTPTGRIVNRFLQDLQNVDLFVPNAIIDGLGVKTLNLVTQVALIVAYCPPVLLLMPLVVPPYWLIFGHVRVAYRNTTRIEAVAHSPVYAEFIDCLHGRETIRAFGREQAFVGSNLRKVNEMAKASYWNEAVFKWAQSLTTMWGCVVYGFCGLCGAYLLCYPDSTFALMPLTASEFGL
eukprot:gene34-19_t